MAKNTPRISWRILRPWRFLPRRTAYWLLLAAVAGMAVLAMEVRDSGMQARVFAGMAKEASFSLQPGPSPHLWLPHSGPYDVRLGYSQMKEVLPKLLASGFQITAQARQSDRFIDLVERGYYPIYREKSQAGLTVLDRHGKPIYATRYPERQYADFDSIPPLLVAALLFIENRELLDDEHPKRNPAVEWDRFGQAVINRTLRLAGGDASRAGGSTLATQIEKFRHSPQGRTHDAAEKLRQMTSAALRAYQEGEDTMPVRRRIVLDFVNSVPLGAAPGIGEINGLGDGLWAWYGRDFDQANAHLAEADEIPEGAAAPFKEALSLFIAQRRPSDLLAENAWRLNELADSHLRLLAREGLISPALRDQALKLKLAPRDKPWVPPQVSFVERKAINAARKSLADLLNVDSLYALDRYDLTAHSTLDTPTQAAVTGLLARMKDEQYLQCAGFRTGEHLLQKGNPKEVRYSFTLYEATPLGNLLRVQADNVDQPLDINVGTKLDLGSTSKFRTLISYLEVIADLHRRYAGLSPAELAKLEFDAGDALSRWAVAYLAAATDKGLRPMLDAALERRYSASPSESFFTGGGIHNFHNFTHEDDQKTPSVAESIEQSINLSFIRIMRDVVHYYAYEAEYAPGREARRGGEAVRRQFLAKFADQEGREFLAHFYRKYRGTAPEDLLPTLISDLRPLPGRLAAAYLGVEPGADFPSFANFMRAQLGGKVDDADLKKLFSVYAPLRLSLSDQGYVARVHPLELWLVGYLKRNPGASFEQVMAASTAERQAAYHWLFASRFRRAQDVRINIMVEKAAFERIAASWRSLGYPFERLVPSYATAIGSSGDRPAALAELMGVVINGGMRRSLVRIDALRFAADTPFETRLSWQAREGDRVLPMEVAQAARDTLLRVVNGGTAKRLKDIFRDGKNLPLPVGGKTGTGDHRFEVFAPGGHLVSSRVMNRAATFVFYIGGHFFGTVTAFVPGEQAGNYDFTSALPAQVLKSLEPVLRPLVSGQPAVKPACSRIAGSP